MKALLVGTAAAAIAAIGASGFVTSRIVRPLRRLTTASRRIADGHYAESVPVSSADELGDLARSFNTMAGALEETERRRRELIGDAALAALYVLAFRPGSQERWLSTVSSRKV